MERLKRLSGKVFGSEFVRFAAVGVIATAVHYGLYLLLKLFVFQGRFFHCRLFLGIGFSGGDCIIKRLQAQARGCAC